MTRSLGVALGSSAVVVEVAILVWPFLAESFWDVALYYTFMTVPPLIAGVLAIGVLVAFAAIRLGRLSEVTGAGVALGLALFSLLVVTLWAFTGRVDVFLAPGWVFPLHRWALVGVSTVVVLGVGLYAHDVGLLRSRW